MMRQYFISISITSIRRPNLTRVLFTFEIERGLGINLSVFLKAVLKKLNAMPLQGNGHFRLNWQLKACAVPTVQADSLQLSQHGNVGWPLNLAHLPRLLCYIREHIHCPTGQCVLC